MRGRALGVALGGWMVLAMPLASACYPQRVESCRGPISDFTPYSNVRIVNPTIPFGFESPTESAAYSVSATAVGPDGDRCLEVRSELRDARGGVVEVMDTPIHARVNAGVLTTSQIFHYHSGIAPLTVHVSVLGQTLDATLVNPRFADSGLFGTDAGVAFFDADFRGEDAGIDVGSLSDGGPIDVDAGDAGDADAGDVDASSDIDAGP